LDADMRRREFISLLGGTLIAWPLAARAQQSATPVIGLLYSSSSGTTADVQRAFRAGLKETGFIENENLTILDRWADNKIERIPDGG
jgi:putative tryptophan/tyrosine transport system substrate-binding protein